MASRIGQTANLLSRRLPAATKWATRRHVDRFRSSNGQKANQLAGSPVFVLDVVGRRSGVPRPVVLMEVRDGADLIVAGSNAGHPETPNWYHNLIAAGEAHVESRGHRWPVTVREVDDGEERRRCWQLLVDGYEEFAGYQELTERTIPIAVLSPS